MELEAAAALCEKTTCMAGCGIVGQLDQPRFALWCCVGHVYAGQTAAHAITDTLSITLTLLCSVRPSLSTSADLDCEVYHQEIEGRSESANTKRRTR